MAKTVEWGLTVHHALCVVNCCIACPPPTPPQAAKQKQGTQEPSRAEPVVWMETKNSCIMKKDAAASTLHCGPSLSFSLSLWLYPTFIHLLSLSYSLTLLLLPRSIHLLLPLFLPFIVPFLYPPPPPSLLSSSSPPPAVCSPTVFPAARWLRWRSSLWGLVFPSSWAFKSCDLSLIGHILHVSFVYGLILFAP